MADARARGWGSGWPSNRSGEMEWVTAPLSGAKWQVHRAVAPILRYIVGEAERRGYLFDYGKKDVNDDWGYVNRPIRGTRTPSNHCLGGDTRVVTRDGIVEIRSLAGQVAEVLTRDPFSQRSHGQWVKAPFASYGVESAREIVLARGQNQRKTITATDPHRWFVRLQSDVVIERTTAELAVDDRLVSCLPPPDDPAIESDAEWHIVSVGASAPTKVFCATVEDTGAFVLEDWILTGNSWGLAVDVDATRYPQGQRSKRPPDWLISLFAQWSWDWGGNWSYADPMHFEFGGTPGQAAQLVAMLAASHIQMKPVPVPPGTPARQSTVPKIARPMEDPMQIVHVPDAPNQVNPDTWFATNGISARPVEPGEPDWLVISGLVPTPNRGADGSVRPVPMPYKYFKKLAR